MLNEVNVEIVNVNFSHVYHIGTNDINDLDNFVPVRGDRRRASKTNFIAPGNDRLSRTRIKIVVADSDASRRTALNGVQNILLYTRARCLPTVIRDVQSFYRDLSGFLHRTLIAGTVQCVFGQTVESTWFVKYSSKIE